MNWTPAAIDFQKLRKEERQRMRALHGDDSATMTRTTRVLLVNQVSHLSNVASSSNEIIRVSPFTQDKEESSRHYASDEISSVVAVGVISQPLQSLLRIAQENPYIHNISFFPLALLSNIFYTDVFLSEEYATRLIQRLQQLPHDAPYASRCHTTAMDDAFGRWTRLQHAQRNVALFDLRTCNMSPISIMLGQISQALVQMNLFPPTYSPNHVLINEYQPHEGIMPHTDGPSYYQKTATISIGGGDVLLKFLRRRTNHDLEQPKTVDDSQLDSSAHTTEVKLSGKGSLIIFQDEAYTDYCHSIQDRLVDDVEVVDQSNNKCVNFLPDHDSTQTMTVTRGYRISLTFRHKLT